MNHSQIDQQLSVQDYLRPLWAQRVLILAVVVAATLGTYVYYDRQPDQYSASTDIFLNASQSAEGILGVAPVPTLRDLANQARLLRTLPVARRVGKDIRFKGDPETLLARISVTPSPDADLVTLSATDGSAQTASDLANAFAQAFIDQRDAARRQAIATAVTATKRELDKLPRSARDSSNAIDLTARLRQLQVLSSTPAATTAQLEKASPSDSPVSPKPARNAVFALALSFLLAAMSAYALERLNARLRSVDTVSEAYGAPVLATLPHASRKSLSGRANGLASGAFLEMLRALRIAVELSHDSGTGKQVLLVTSGSESEGKSTVARNLAVAFRETGRRVVILEADLRRPSLASSVGLAAAPGLTDVLAQRAQLDEALQSITVELPGIDEIVVTSTNGTGQNPDGGCLQALTSGERTANPSTVLSGLGVGVTIQQLRQSHEIIIIDSAPLIPVADTLQILSLVDSVILVSRLGFSTPTSAARLQDLMTRFPHGAILGVVVNDVPASGYGYGYSYATSDDEARSSV